MSPKPKKLYFWRTLNYNCFFLKASKLNDLIFMLNMILADLQNQLPFLIKVVAEQLTLCYYS